MSIGDIAIPITTQSTYSHEPPESLILTRGTLEVALLNYSLDHEGPLAQEYVALLLRSGEVLEALNKVAASMLYKKSTFSDNPSCLIWSAWMNYQEYGSPGFALSKSNPCE